MIRPVEMAPSDHSEESLQKKPLGPQCPVYCMHFTRPAAKAHS